MRLAELVEKVSHFERQVSTLRRDVERIDRALVYFRAALDHERAGRYGSASRALSQAFALLGEER